MSASSIKHTCLALCVAAAFASAAKAQLDDPCSPFYGCSNDLRFFEPVDLDLDCRGCCEPCGFFFDYDKIFWTASGEVVEIGDPDTVQQQFRVWSAIPLDPVSGQPIAPPLLTNSIQDTVPDAFFSGGDRYEFGYIAEDGRGFSMTVLNGPEYNHFFTLGTNGGFQNDIFQDGLALPYGDVFVSFRTAPGVLAGFLDVEDFEDGILGDDDDGDGILDGDGFADDVNDNGQHGADGFDTEDPFNEPDAGIIGALPDYGDLVILTTDFAFVNIRNRLSVNGFEIMRTIRIDNSHLKVQHQNNHFEWGYGARFLQLDDQQLFQGFGNGFFLGDSEWDTSIVNNIVGPQLAYKWTRSNGRWSIGSQGRFAFGYNIRDWDQRGFIAEDSTISRPNNPLYLRPKSFSYSHHDDDFSPIGELRLDLKYRLTDNIALNLGWSGTFVDNIRRASTSVDYALYDENGKVMGFRDGGTQELFANGVNFGVEIRQ